jgi:hypothetical protein
MTPARSQGCCPSVRWAQIVTARHCVDDRKPWGVVIGRKHYDPETQAGFISIAPVDDVPIRASLLHMHGGDLAMIYVPLPPGQALVASPTATLPAESLTLYVWGGEGATKNRLHAYETLKRIDDPTCGDAWKKAQADVGLRPTCNGTVQGRCAGRAGLEIEDRNSGGALVVGNSLVGVLSGHEASVGLFLRPFWCQKGHPKVTDLLTPLRTCGAVGNPSAACMQELGEFEYGHEIE